VVVRWENRLHFLTRPRRSSVTVARQIENDDGPARSQPPLNLRPASPCELPPPLSPLVRILTATARSIRIPTISTAQSWPNTQRECHPIRRSVSRRANRVTKTLAEEIRGGLRFHRREHMQMVSLQLGPLGDLASIGSVNHDRSNLVLEDIRQPCWCGWGPRFVAPSKVDSTHHATEAAKRRLRHSAGRTGGTHNSPTLPSDLTTTVIESRSLTPNAFGASNTTSTRLPSASSRMTCAEMNFNSDGTLTRLRT